MTHDPVLTAYIREAQRVMSEIEEQANRECPHEDHESMADFYSDRCCAISMRIESVKRSLAEVAAKLNGAEVAK